MKRVHLLITGLVQGVWYRASAEQEAQRLGLQGWVRNLPDGRVEALAEGPEAVLQTFIAWCHRGPQHARVEQVESNWGEATGEFSGFSVHR